MRVGGLDTMTVRGVILAAGMGKRMGATKQLLPFLGKPLLQHVIDAASAANLIHLTLILGHDYETVLAQIAVQGVEVVQNPDYAQGQSTSLRAGLTVGPDADGILFLLGDQPLVQPSTMNALIDAFTRHRPWAAVPVHRNKPGNPVLVGRPLYPFLSALTGDCGARHVLQQYQENIRYVLVDDPGILHDVDTPEAYQSLCTDHTIHSFLKRN